MKVVIVSFCYDESLTTEEEFLRQNYTITGWAEALQRKGVQVTVISRFHKQSSFKKNEVLYHFNADYWGGKCKASQLPVKFLKKISKLDADIVHLHNLGLSVHTFVLRSFLSSRTAIVVQHHGGPLPRGGKKSFHDLLNKVADGFFFTTIEQGKEWFKSKKMQKKVMPVMEGATFFDYENRLNDTISDYRDRNVARKHTGMNGAPVLLWVGRLDYNKDPLTVIDGFQIFVKTNGAASLYMIFSEGILLNEVRNRIASSDVLKDKIHLLGKIPHDEIENYYTSADYFVLGSHYEGSGYALSEALRCGCIPIVTNIPSFKMMTNNGRLGAQWQPGSISSLIAALTVALNKPLHSEANACIEFFRSNLCFSAIAQTAIEHYRRMMEKRSKPIADQ